MEHLQSWGVVVVLLLLVVVVVFTGHYETLKCLRVSLKTLVRHLKSLHCLSYRRALKYQVRKRNLTRMRFVRFPPDMSDYRLAVRPLTFQHRTSSIKCYKVRSSPRFVHSSAVTPKVGILVNYLFDRLPFRAARSFLSPTHLFRL